MKSRFSFYFTDMALVFGSIDFLMLMLWIFRRQHSL